MGVGLRYVPHMLIPKSKEYLYHLVEAVRKLAPESRDSHLYALEVCRILCTDLTISNSGSRSDEVSSIG